jgi:16S rRNA (cytosine1402-N4)-methyltransferase
VSTIHIPVLLKEIIDGLTSGGGKTYVDCTVGTGGHTLALLSRAKGTIRVIGLDKDEESLNIARERLKQYAQKVTLIHGGFEELDTLIPPLAPGPISGILFDLGMSSFQLSEAERGFSFRESGPLDMRFDRSCGVTGEEIINRATKEELYALLNEYGEERWSRRLSRVITERTAQAPFHTTDDLSMFIRRNIPRKAAHKTLARVFQALRIAVNDELDNIKTGLVKGVDLLEMGGRIAVVAYHSLEDRIVSSFFRTMQKAELLRIVNPRCIRPSKDERLKNRRSRSARLRIAIKTRELAPERRKELFPGIGMKDEQGSGVDD